jgi:hypothetical protein
LRVDGRCETALPPKGRKVALRHASDVVYVRRMRYEDFRPDPHSVSADVQLRRAYAHGRTAPLWQPMGWLRDFLVLPVRYRRKDTVLPRIDRTSAVQSRGFIMQGKDSFDLAALIRNERIFEWFPELPESVVMRVTKPNGVRSPFRAVRLAYD